MAMRSGERRVEDDRQDRKVTIAYANHEQQDELKMMIVYATIAKQDLERYQKGAESISR